LTEALASFSAKGSRSAMRWASAIVFDLKLVPRHHAVHQAGPLGLGGADEIAGEEILLGLARPEVPRHREILHVRAAPLHGAVGELCIIAGNDEGRRPTRSSCRP